MIDMINVIIKIYVEINFFLIRTFNLIYDDSLYYLSLSLYPNCSFAFGFGPDFSQLGLCVTNCLTQQPHYI